MAAAAWDWGWWSAGRWGASAVCAQARWYPAVMAATLIGGWQAGILAQVAGGVVAWLYFDPSLMPPTQSFDEQVVAFSLYGLSSGFIIWASEQYRHVVRRLDEEQHYRRLVVDELRHRLRNKLAVVQAVLGHELRAHAKITERLKALARADELLLQQDHEMVGLHELLRVELSLYGNACVALKGQPVELPAKVAAALTLVFHELATNAAKYGAFKLPEGRVSIGWQLESSSLRVEWSEGGGPPVTAPKRSGFGGPSRACRSGPDRACGGAFDSRTIRLTYHIAPKSEYVNHAPNERYAYFPNSSPSRGDATQILNGL